MRQSGISDYRIFWIYTNNHRLCFTWLMTSSNPRECDAMRGYWIAFASAAILSTTAIFIRYLTDRHQVPAMVLAFWRDFFAVIVLLPILALVRASLLRVTVRHLGYLAVYGIVLAGFNLLWTYSVALNGASVATALVYSSGAFTALLGWRIFGETFSVSKVAAVIASLVGCWFVSGASMASDWRSSFTGITVGVLSGFAYAVYSLMGRSAARRGLNPWTTLFYTFGFATLVLLILILNPGGVVPGSPGRPPLTLLTEVGVLPLEPVLQSGTPAMDLFCLGHDYWGWLVLFVLAGGPTIAGFGLYNMSLAHLPSSVANLIVSLEPAFTAAIAFLLLDERLNPAQVTGGLLILGAVVGLRFSESRGEGDLRVVPRVAASS